jgi:hypothetical protein
MVANLNVVPPFSQLERGFCGRNLSKISNGVKSIAVKVHKTATAETQEVQAGVSMEAFVGS